jgi:hypothetical protein
MGVWGQIFFSTKNVHQDIQALEQAGLVSRNSAQTLSVPWGRILAEISLAA